MRPLGHAAAAADFLLLAAVVGARSCAAQPVDGRSAAAHGAPISRDQPVTFTADQVDYDRDRAIVTATGHVEAWQNDHVVRADKMTFDRNTNIAAAYGHVVLLEPDGQVLFTDYAELSEGMRNAVLRGMRAILAENGRLAANGARRFEGKLNELSRVVYSTCNLCAKDPTRPPLWQIRALDAVQDLEHKRIEYQDATLQMCWPAGRLLAVFLASRPVGKAAVGAADPLDRLVVAYRAVHQPALLHGAR